MVEELTLNAVDSKLKRTALHYAAACGHADVVGVLVSLGANVDARDVDGRTAVHVASSEGRRDVVLWMKSVAEGKKKRTKGPSYLGTILASAVRASSRLLPKPKDKDKGKDKDGGKTADDTGGGDCRD